MTYHRIFKKKSNTTSATSGAGNAYHSGVSDVHHGFKWISCCSICT